jgi:hypothetical protein
MPAAEPAQGKRKVPDPPETMVTPDKKIHAPSGSSGSSARRILFNNDVHKEQDQQGPEFEEVQSKSQVTPPVCTANAALISDSACQHASVQLSAAARDLFGNMPSKEQMGQYFQAAEHQVSSWIPSMNSFRAE